MTQTEKLRAALSAFTEGTWIVDDAETAQRFAAARLFAQRVLRETAPKPKRSETAAYDRHAYFWREVKAWLYYTLPDYLYQELAGVPECMRTRLMPCPQGLGCERTWRFSEMTLSGQNPDAGEAGVPMRVAFRGCWHKRLPKAQEVAA